MDESSKAVETHLDGLLGIEEQLIDLIQATSHAGALDYLTKALCEVRKAHYYLDGDNFRGPRASTIYE